MVPLVLEKAPKTAPNALRDILNSIESYSPYLNASLDEVIFYDLGNLSAEITLTNSSDVFAAKIVCELIICLHSK